MALCVFYGMAAHKFQLFPYPLTKAAYNGLFPPNEHLETPKEYFETDVAQLISIRQPQDVLRLREGT